MNTLAFRLGQWHLKYDFVLLPTGSDEPRRRRR